MAIRGDKARSPNSPRRVRPVADRAGEKASPNKKGEKVLCRELTMSRFIETTIPCVVPPSSRGFEACCKLARPRCRHHPALTVEVAVAARAFSYQSRMLGSAVICPTPSIAKEIHVL